MRTQAELNGGSLRSAGPLPMCPRPPYDDGEQRHPRTRVQSKGTLMSITSPVSHHTNVRRRVAAAAAVLVALMSGAACSAGATEPSVVTASASSPAEPRPSATVDELVGADGSRLHVRCVGHGDTTVLLIAGFGDGGRWDKIEPSISGQARVCSYARPGTGTSDPPSSTQTFISQANDLRSLLHAIGEPGPYVVVGHSFGGA